MKTVKFTVLGEPTGKGRPQTKVMYSEKGFKNKKTGKVRNTLVNNVTPKKTVIYENEVKDMRIIAYYRIPKSQTKRNKELMKKQLLRPTKKPDMDNVVKIIADSLNQIAYRDDTQIVDCQCRKFYSDNPRVEVTIKEVKPDVEEK